MERFRRLNHMEWRSYSSMQGTDAQKQDVSAKGIRPIFGFTSGFLRSGFGSLRCRRLMVLAILRAISRRNSIGWLCNIRTVSIKRQCDNRLAKHCSLRKNNLKPEREFLEKS